MHSVMGSDDPIILAENPNRILNGTESSDLAASWMEFPHLTDDIQ